MECSLGVSYTIGIPMLPCLLLWHPPATEFGWGLCEREDLYRALLRYVEAVVYVDNVGSWTSAFEFKIGRAHV